MNECRGWGYFEDNEDSSFSIWKSGNLENVFYCESIKLQSRKVLGQYFESYESVWKLQKT